MDENNELMAPEYHIDYTDSQVTVSENWLYVDPQSRDLHGLIFEERVGYFNHSFVESPDMMNMYNGNVVLNHKGEAWVELPEWFETLNRDFRYQLTPIGARPKPLHS